MLVPLDTGRLSRDGRVTVEGWMAVNLATLNVRGLRDLSKCARLFGKLSNLGVYVAAAQETHFSCAKDCLSSFQHTAAIAALKSLY